MGITPDQFDADARELAAQYRMAYNDNLTLYADNVSKASIISERDRAMQEAEATIADLRKQLGEKPPEQPPTNPTGKKPLIGITTQAGPVKIAGACERGFDGGAGITKVPTRRTKASCPRLHYSWKVFGDPAPTDAQIIAAFKNLLDGDKVEVEHETDAKFHKDNSAADLAARLKIKDAFYDQVKRLRDAGKIPKVDVVNTLTYWSFASNGPKDYAKFYCKADVLGVDFDGDDATDGYRNYEEPEAIKRIVAWAFGNYNGRWTVPEHSWNKSVVGERVPRFKVTIPAIAAYGPEEIQIFDAKEFAPLLTAAELKELTTIAKQYNG